MFSNRLVSCKTMTVHAAENYTQQVFTVTHTAIFVIFCTPWQKQKLDTIMLFALQKTQYVSINEKVCRRRRHHHSSL